MSILDLETLEELCRQSPRKLSRTQNTAKGSETLWIGDTPVDVTLWPIEALRKAVAASNALDDLIIRHRRLEAIIASHNGEITQLRSALESLMLGCINGGYHPSTSLRQAFTLLGGYKTHPWLRDLRLPLPDDDEVSE